jgi:hypothetical protein
LLDALGLDLRLVSSKIEILSTNPDFTGGDRLPEARERRTQCRLGSVGVQMLRIGEVLFQLISAATDFPCLRWHPVTGRIGIVEAILRIERAIAQALANGPGGGRFVGASARRGIGILNQRLPAPRPGRRFGQEERVDAIMIDAIEPTEAVPTVPVPV